MALYHSTSQKGRVIFIMIKETWTWKDFSINRTSEKSKEIKYLLDIPALLIADQPFFSLNFIYSSAFIRLRFSLKWLHGGVLDLIWCTIFCFHCKANGFLFKLKEREADRIKIRYYLTQIRKLALEIFHLTMKSRWKFHMEYDFLWTFAQSSYTGIFMWSEKDNNREEHWEVCRGCRSNWHKLRLVKVNKMFTMQSRSSFLIQIIGISSKFSYHKKD